MDGLILGGPQLPPPSQFEPDALNWLRQNSAGVAKRIKELYEKRKKDDGDYVELCEQMSQLERFLHKPKDQFSHRAWLVFMEECEPAAMHTQFRLCDGFFEEDALFVARVFQGFERIAIASIEMEDTETQHFLLANCSALFQAVWINREPLLTKSVAAETGVLQYGHPVLRCLEPFQKLHTSIRGRPASLDSYLPHVSLFGWLGFKNTLHSQDGLAYLDSLENPISDDDLDAFVQDAVFNGMGVETLFKSLEDALEDLSRHEVLVRFMPTILRLCERPAMRHLLHQRDIFNRFVIRLGHFTHLSGLDDDDSKGPWIEWMTGFNLYLTMRTDQVRALTFARENLAKISVRGEDGIVYMSYGARWIAQAAFGRRTNDHHYLGFIVYCNAITKELHEYANFSFMSSLSEGAPDFIAGLVRGMRGVWMSTLIALRAGRSELGEFSDSYNRLLDAWTMLGTAMGLDESWERKEMRKFCSHRRCPFNMRQPPNALLACRGCGEARYCTKECQRSDWKVHKRLCGKRLK